MILKPSSVEAEDLFSNYELKEANGQYLILILLQDLYPDEIYLFGWSHLVF